MLESIECASDQAPTSSSSLLVPFYTVQNMKFSIKDFISKCDQIRSFLQICSHLLKKSLMENFIYCAVRVPLKSPNDFRIPFEYKRFAKLLENNFFMVLQSF